jgi:hypothetical protein
MTGTVRMLSGGARRCALWTVLAIALLPAAARVAPAAAPESSATLPPVSTAAPAEAASPASPDEKETRIVFKRGAIQGVGHGQLTGMTQELHFVVRAKSGQQMRLSVEADGPTRGLVTFPNGDTDGGPGPVFFDDTLPADGDYHIKITESSMGQAWTGGVTLHVRIK